MLKLCFQSPVLGLCLAALLLAGCAASEAPRVATGYAAHLLCSGVHVSGRPADDVWAEDVASAPGLKLVAGGFERQVGADGVAVTLWGGSRATARPAEGRGCTLEQSAQPLPPGDAFAVDPLSAPDQPVLADGAVAEAIARLLSAEDRPKQRVRAIVIVHRGRIVGEYYAPGVGPRTALLGWSLAKSVVNALTGRLVAQGKLDVQGPAPVPEWATPEDPRHAISVEALLRQTSGQPFGAGNNGFDRASQMLFLADDTAAVAASARFRPAGTFSYTDGNYAILSGILARRIGGGPAGFGAFAHRALFGPLAMRDTLFEFDQAGNPLGAAFVHASARDWARFGLLFLNDGVVGGVRLLPAGWVGWSAAPTASSEQGYAAGFWSNRGESRGARTRRGWGAPADSFFGNGNYGQTLLIMPGAQLIVVRLGRSDDDGRLSLERTVRLAAEVQRALD